MDETPRETPASEPDTSSEREPAPSRGDGDRPASATSTPSPSSSAPSASISSSSAPSAPSTPTPASNPPKSLVRVTPPPPDRGRQIGLAALMGFAAVGMALVVVVPRPKEESASKPAALTHATVRASASASGSAPAITDAGAPRAADAGRPPPAWRVASLKNDASVEVVEGTFGKRSFVAALTHAGISKADAKHLAQSFEGVRHVEHPREKESFVVAKDRAKGTLMAFELIGSPTDVWQARVDEVSADRRITTKKLELWVEKKRVTAALAITEDLAKAVGAAGLREDAVDAVDEAIEGHLDQASLRPGMRVRLVADEIHVEGAYARFHVEALELLPKKGNALRVYAYTRDETSEGRGRSRHRGPRGYYDAKGQKPYQGAFRSPVPLARITSRFNPKRMHPVLHVVMPHNGVDFGASTGTPVYAAAPGTVTQAGNAGPCGNMVEIEHEKGVTTAYCHLSKFATGLSRGQKVEARQLVGYVGATGRVTGPHLHFIAKRAGNFIDPMELKLDGVVVLPTVDREPFHKRRVELDAALEAIPLAAAATADAGADDDDDKDNGEDE